MSVPVHSDTSAPMRVLVTGGAGYIGSLLVGVLLNRGDHVTVVDELLFGGESLLGYWHHPNFRFAKGDVCDKELIKVQGTTLKVGELEASTFDAVVHLAAIVGFPACQAVGKQVAWRYNVEATQQVFAAADAAGVKRFVLSSTYSNYGVGENGQPVTEESPLYPQSLYAETKIAAEEYLLRQAERSRCAPLVFRFATLFGISPRTRFDLIVNQFVRPGGPDQAGAGDLSARILAILRACARRGGGDHPGPVGSRGEGSRRSVQPGRRRRELHQG